MRDIHSAPLKEVYITPDLSAQERKIQKELRAELKRQKENDDANLKIYRGKVVKVNTEPVTEMVVDPVPTTESSNNSNA